MTLRRLRAAICGVCFRALCPTALRLWAGLGSGFGYRRADSCTAVLVGDRVAGGPQRHGGVGIAGGPQHHGVEHQAEGAELIFLPSSVGAVTPWSKSASTIRA